MTNRELHDLINRYFNGETTLDEERTLRRALAKPPHDAPAHDPLADDARAVMGFSLAAPARKTRHVPSMWRSVAAVVVAAITATTIITGSLDNREPQYVAYLNGERIADKDAVMNLMLSDLHEMGEASASVEADIANDLNEIADIMNSLN